MFHSTWGHVITDNIRRLWFLKSDDFKSQFKNLNLVYLLCTKREIFTLDSYKNFRRLLKILEVDFDKLELIEYATKYDKIILPDESFYFDTDNTRKFTAEYRETVDRVRDFALKNRISTTSKKIYYFHGTRQIGEDRIAYYFKSKGYEIIFPEKLNFDEQLNLLVNCESFASTLGSISHNSIFLRYGTETVFIPRYVQSFNSYQQTCDQVNSLNANYVNSSLSIFGDCYSNHCFIISKQLKRFFGDKFNGYEEDDFKIFLLYVKISMNRGRSFNQNSEKYYSSVLEDFMEQLKKREDLITA